MGSSIDTPVVQTPHMELVTAMTRCQPLVDNRLRYIEQQMRGAVVPYCANRFQKAHIHRQHQRLHEVMS